MSDHAFTKKSVFDKRAESLAKVKVESSKEKDGLLLCFYVNDEKYAIEQCMINKVISSEQVTSLPMVMNLFCGVMYREGMLWPVLDTGLFFQKKKVVYRKI